ncbi:hypothetical protein D3C87_1152750 [compost metagenome]
MQAVQADHSLGIGAAPVLRNEVAAGRLVARAIGQVRQGFALFIEQLELDPVHFLFAAHHSLAGAQCVRTVQSIVHVSPLMLLVIYSETAASRQRLICTKQLNTPFFPE